MLAILTTLLFYSVAAAAVLLAYWFIVIRYGDKSDLDPEGLFVRWFAKRSDRVIASPNEMLDDYAVRRQMLKDARRSIAMTYSSLAKVGGKAKQDLLSPAEKLPARDVLINRMLESIRAEQRSKRMMAQETPESQLDEWLARLPRTAVPQQTKRIQ